ncbi:11952_t:CDS:2 [Funneliformis mosseae]|uniref:11952_t:CDS:1 n=1 Tax=Funneliformis mosseae TaxID=27381 RepID=A0A9N8WD81_FUNMO|nr:11952_t:CDS:2 [Funneliformis mosseae]
MAQTAGQLLGQAIPACQWIPQNIPNTTSTLPAYPRAQPLRVEDDAKTHLHTNALFPVEGLFPQGSSFSATPIRFLGASDYVLCNNNYTVAKMPVEMKTRHNLDLRGYHFWQIYRYNNRRGIMNPRFGDRRFDPNFKFKKRILSRIFGQMAWKRKRKSKSSSIPIASSSKGITTIDKYIGGGSFGKVFSGYYNNQDVAWKTCDAYKEQEEIKTLKHEAHIYSILKGCQGRDIPRLFYNGYIYDGYLFALALQLIEGAHHVDPERLTKEKKKLIVNQLKSIHNCDILHNDISEKNILYELKSRHYFFIDFGLSEIMGRLYRIITLDEEFLSLQATMYITLILNHKM